MAKTTWTPNETQSLFLEVLRKADGKAMTLSEISEVAGKPIASGSINTLKTKGLVETEKVTYECNLVRKDTGAVVGSAKKALTFYKLVAPTAKAE